MIEKNSTFIIQVFSDKCLLKYGIENIIPFQKL